MTDRCDALADVHFFRVRDLEGAQIRRRILHTKQRKIQILVSGHDLYEVGLREILLVVTRDRVRLEVDHDIPEELPARRVCDHVIIREDEAVLSQD